MKNRLRQVNRTTVKTKNNAVRYVAGGLALALFGGIITFIYLNTNQTRNALAADTDITWYLDFGSQTGIHSDKSSNTFINDIPSGTGRVSVVDAKRDFSSFTLQNPGISNLGSGSELKGVASLTSAPAKFSVNNYTPGKTFYIKYSAEFDEAKDGEWYFFIGNGATYASDNPFTQNEVFAGLQIVYNKKNKINLYYMDETQWSAFPSGDYSITPNDTYTFELYGNNSTKAINYTYGNSKGCTSTSVNANSYNLYINGVLVAENLGNAGLAKDTNIDDWMFYGVNSKKNDAVIYLDDIAYSNVIPTNTIAPREQPTGIVFKDTTSSSMTVSFTAAKYGADGYLVLRKEGSSISATPSDNTIYKAGATIGDATVAYVGTNTSLFETNLAAGTTYYYKVFAFNGSVECINYLNSLPLSGSQMTFYNEEIAPFSSLSDGNWSTPANWEYEYLPGKFKKASKTPANTNKSITVRKKNKIISTSVVANNVTIQSEGILVINGDLTIGKWSPGSDFSNEGTLIVTGKFELQGKMENKEGSLVELSGTAEQIIPEGNYSKLKVSNKGNKKLNGDITITQSLQLNSSALNTSNYTVNLSSSANILGEDGTNHIIGKVKTIRALSNSIEDFGGIGATIDATANLENLGDVTIIRTTGTPVVVENSTSLSRTWSIEPQFQPKKDVKLTLDWDEIDEDIPFDLTKMQVWKSTDKGKNWMAVGAVQAAAGRKITVVTPSFSIWTVSDQMNTLPVKFKSFTGTEQSNNTVILNWATYEELNNAGFEIQRSLDGKTFEKIGYIEGEGTSSHINNYEFTDQNFTSKAYYRLKQIDFNGESDYSEIVFVDKKITGGTVEKSFNIYPNPVIDHVSIGSSLPDLSTIEVIIHNSKGKQMLNTSGSLDEVNGELESSIFSWEADIYIIDIRCKGKTERLKMIKR